MVCYRVLVASLAVMIAFGCAKKDEPSKVASSPQGSKLGGPDGTKPKSAGPDLASAKPDVVLTPEEWLREWTKDEKLAAQKYQGKVIELTGEVDRVDGHPQGEAGIIYLKVGTENVNCYTLDREPWFKASAGTKVKIRGKSWTADSGSWGKAYNLYPSVIIEGTPTTTVLAEQLAKDFAADPKAAESKYDHKNLIVEGEIASKKPGDLGQFALKGGGDKTVPCSWTMLSDFEKNRHESLKVGQQVKLFGEVSVSKDKISIQGCQMQPK